LSVGAIESPKAQLDRKMSALDGAILVELEALTISD
jgi:hypothetical protein